MLVLDTNKKQRKLAKETYSLATLTYKLIPQRAREVLTRLVAEQMFGEAREIAFCGYFW